MKAHYRHHINYRDGRLFHHAWFWDSLKISTWSGPALRLEFQRGEAGGGQNGCSLTLGLIFFTVCLTFGLPDRFLLKRKCIAAWDGNKEFYLVDGRRYGFYFYHWAFSWSWHAKVNQSSSTDPWWMRQYIQLDDLALGQMRHIENEITSITDVWFRLGSKEFKIDSIKWSKMTRFRSHIPFSLWSSSLFRVAIDIKNPPMHSGKGENSWDCGDDGTYGMSAPWEGPAPKWSNTGVLASVAVKLYVDSVKESVRKYGGSSSERGVRLSDAYQYIGRRPSEGNENAACLAKPPTVK